ncbi:protein-tyrosine phosphatase-like protein [Fusarium oxysporum II5]|nr:protein-tyrosine phosphatase-like protein [Fusarium oxysporum II5]
MDNTTKRPPSTEWSELFAQNPSYEPTTYKALDNLASNGDLAFLHAKFWNEIREWTRNDITDMSRIVHPDLAGPGSIFIGGMNHALNEDILAKNDIHAVIAIHPKDSLAWDKSNTSYGLQRFFPGENGITSSVVKYPLIIPLEDNANSNLIDYFDETNAFIKWHTGEGRNILIHCKSGRSRSVAVLIAYMQQKFCSEKGIASVKDKSEAKEQMRMHREEITEAIRTQRLPVVVIMERFDELLARYDLKLIEDPCYESEKINRPPASETMKPKLGEPDEQPELVAKKESKVVQTKGGAAVLKICVASAFFKNNQKPTEAVVHQFFEVNEAYFYELEALEYKGRSSASAGLTSRVLARWTKSDRGEIARLTYTNLTPSKWRRSRRLQMHISAATFLKILVSTCEYGWDTESDRLIAAIYYWKDYKAGCGSPSTCSTPSGGKSWGCCDETSCYIPATCEDASAPDCGGTAASLCPYSPIMKCTYGASSRCLYFIYQTASDDNDKVTSWGCGETPTTYIVGPLQVEQTASATAPTNDETDSNSGLSKDATIALAVILPVVGLAILVAAAMLFIRRRKKRERNAVSRVADGARSEMEQTTECAPVPAVPPYEMGDNVLRPELDSRETLKPLSPNR